MPHFTVIKVNISGMVYNIEAVADNIRRTRQDRHYSQDQLAIKLNISLRTYRRLESGKTKISLERFFTIAEELGVTVYELIHSDYNKAVYSEHWPLSIVK